MQADSSLRAIANRLTVTPVEELPRICGFLANQLANCSLESHFSDLKSSNSSSVAAHKLKTRIGSLLQDRSTSGRLTAAVLIKAVVENGGQNAVSTSESWARGLLGCLNKPDAIEIKKLYLITITRIFLLTQGHPHLLREITTPLLPHFIKSCLGLIKPAETQVSGKSTRAQSPLLDTVLTCWLQLLPQHATVFRPELTRIKAVCHGLLGAEGSSTATRDLATRLLCLLLSCSPKNQFSQEWSNTAGNILNSAHDTADKLFRAVLEEYESNDSARQKSIGKQDFSKEPHLLGPDPLGLEPWKGIYQGSLRLSTLLTWLGTLLSTPTPQPVAIPAGAIIDLSARIAAVAVTTSAEPVRYHKEASKDEREELRINLPLLNISCLHLLHTMCSTYGQALLPVYRTIAIQAMALLQDLSYHEGVRQSVYDLVGYLLQASNPNELALSRDTFSTLVTECCHDLKRGVPGLDVQSNRNDATDGALTAKSTLGVTNAPGQNARSAPLSRKESDVYASAWTLLPKIFEYGPISLISRQLRAEMDRLSVLLDHREAMLASVMRPVLSKNGKANSASLLPFLARSAGNGLAVEALLRPRMPVIEVGAPSVPDAPESQPPTDLMGEESDHHHADDTLSRAAGEPLSKLDSSSPRAGHGQESVNGLRDLENRGLGEDAATKKRTYTDIGESPQAATGPIPGTTELREVKRLRPEDAPTSVPASTLQDSSENDVQMEGPPEPRSAGPSTGFESPPHIGLSASNTVPEPSVAGGSTLEQDGDDSDDSEIPTIDAGLDTDEEEEEDEDEEEQ